LKQNIMIALLAAIVVIIAVLMIMREYNSPAGAVSTAPAPPATSLMAAPAATGPSN
jgi:hypothetical protein